MKKILVSIAATGVLALAGVAGTAASASAASIGTTSTATPNSQEIAGPFPSPQACEAYVYDAGEWGIWDCEPVSGPDGGWYVFGP